MLESLTEIHQYLQPILIAARLNSSEVYAVQLAVEEACSNVVEHAYGLLPGKEMELTVQDGEAVLVVLLRDWGEPVRPEAVVPQPVKKLVKAHARGGLGLHFMRQLMDEVNFERTQDGANLLRMAKYKRDTV